MVAKRLQAELSRRKLAAKELKVLMIGNSFSICVGKNLPRIVKSVPGLKLELTSAYIGGCPFDIHSKNLEMAEKDPRFKPYGIKVWSSDPSRIRIHGLRKSNGL